MTVNISKPALNLREKLAELDKPSGIAGEAVLRADTTAEAREAVELSNVADSATANATINTLPIIQTMILPMLLPMLLSISLSMMLASCCQWY